MSLPSAVELHEHALEAQKYLEALATGLAHHDADPQVVQSITDMAETTRGLVKLAAKLAEGDTPPKDLTQATDALHADLQAARPQGGAY